MRYRITHTNNYYYARNVSLCHNLAHLTARSCAWQTCLSSRLLISTPPMVSTTRTDYFGNVVSYFTVQEPHKKLKVTAINEVDVHPEADPGARPDDGLGGRPPGPPAPTATTRR